MKYKDIEKAASLKYEYDLLIKINNEISTNGASPNYVSLYSNSEKLMLPKRIADKLKLLIKEELNDIKKQIEEI